MGLVRTLSVSLAHVAVNLHFGFVLVICDVCSLHFYDSLVETKRYFTSYYIYDIYGPFYPPCAEN